MTSFLLESLLATTSAFLLIYFPFAGAFLIFQKSYRSSIESKIFEIGQKIVGILYETEDTISPVSMADRYFIDLITDKLSVLNRDIAIHQAAEKIAGPFRDEGFCELLGKIETAGCYLSIATTRFEELVPDGIHWTGKRLMYGGNNNKTSPKNALFPFGTKLYRQWIRRFTFIYDDIWLCVNSPHKKEYSTSFFDMSEANAVRFVDDYLQKIHSTVVKLRPLHSQLLGQLYILDAVTDNDGPKKKLILISTYILLLVVCGYGVPKFLEHAGSLTTTGVSLLFIFSLIFMGLATIRLVTRLGAPDEMVELRKIYLRPLRGQAQSIGYAHAGLKTGDFENTLSMAQELRLPESYEKLINEYVRGVTAHNRAGRQLDAELTRLIDDLKATYHSQEDIGSGMVFNTGELSKRDFDFEGRCRRIALEKPAVSIRGTFQDSSNDLITIETATLDEPEFEELMRRLGNVRQIALSSRAGADLWDSKSTLTRLYRELDAKTAELLSRKGPIWLKPISEFY